MDHQSKLLLNEIEAAQILSISRHFLRRDRISSSSVGIPFIRIGSAVRYRIVDLEKWIDGRSHVPETAFITERAAVPTNDDKRARGRPRKQASNRY